MSNNTIADISASSIADKLQDLITAKQDMKDALTEKGFELEGGVSTYADAISNIIQDESEPNTIKFGYNTDMVSLPDWDTSEYTDLSWMYVGCMSLKRAPAIDTSNAVDARYMFDNCQQLSYVPLYDFGNVKDVTDMFEMSSLHNSVTYEGFKDLGKQADLIGTERMFDFRWSAIVQGQTVTMQSRINVINNLYDRASAGYSILSINLGNYKIDVPSDRLPDDIIAIATNKGWIITV